MRTRNLAIVFTDIAGFTARTARQTHEENRRLLRAHDLLLKPVFRSFGGRVVKTIGDAFLVVFPSPTDAVICGAALQDRLWEWNRRCCDDLRLDVRVAIHVGEVRLERGDVFGSPVNVAARVEALAHPGEVVFTDAVFACLEPGRLRSRDLGVRELRGVPEPVRLFSVERAEHVGTPPYEGLGRRNFGALPEVDEASVRRRLVRRARAIGISAAAAIAALVLGGGSLRAGALSKLSQPSGLYPGLGSGAPSAGHEATGSTTAALPATGAAQPMGHAEAKAARRAQTGPQHRLRAQGTAASSAPSIRPRIRHETSASPAPAAAVAAYHEGHDREAHKQWDAAAARYEAAARQGEQRGRERLVSMLGKPWCRARVQAATALGRLGDLAAAPGLRALLAEIDLPDEGRGLTLFECSSKRAARDALDRLTATAAR